MHAARVEMRALLFVLVPVVLAPLAACEDEPAGAASQPGPAAARQGLGDDGALHVSAEDRCPVCAMKPAKNPKLASAMVLEDGRTFYFCGTGCMLRAHLHPEEHLGVSPDAIHRAVVPDYFTGEPLDAAEAHWVGGSDVSGPMGPALVPLSDEAAADRFVERHGGEHRFRLKELDDARFREITGRGQ